MGGVGNLFDLEYLFGYGSRTCKVNIVMRHVSCVKELNKNMGPAGFEPRSGRRPRGHPTAGANTGETIRCERRLATNRL